MPFCHPVENVSILLFILIHKIPEATVFLGLEKAFHEGDICRDFKR